MLNVPQRAASAPAAPTRKRFLIVAAAFGLPYAVLISGCQEKQDLIIRDDKVPNIQLTADSKAVRRLISHEEALEKTIEESWQKNAKPENFGQQLKDVHEHPERYTPGRSDFLLAIQEQPAVVVRGPAHVEIVSTSLAACTLIPFATSNFVNVRVREGPERGKEGWLCSEKLGVNDAKTKIGAAQAKAEPPIKTALCELVAHPDTYIGRVVEVRAVVKEGFEVSLLTDSSCSARIWLDTTTANLDEEQYQRIESYLRSSHGLASVVGRFDHVGWFARLKGGGFGHLSQWASQLVMLSFKGA
jgi:hypothetical protein